MATFYLDHDLVRQVQSALQARGHHAVRTRELGHERADDAAQLFFAARAGYVLVTHNERDFKLLQRAWRRWPAPLRHAGVLVIPQQRWTADQAAEELDQFVQSGRPLTDELYWWTVDRGWVRFE